MPRFVYGSREGQKIEHVPLDNRLQLPEQKFSYLLQDWGQEMATELPFGKVDACLSRILGFTQSVNSLEQTNRALAGPVETFWGTVAAPPAKQEGELMVLTADGKGVVMRPSELDAQETAAAKPSGRPGNKKMALVGSAYTVDPYPRSPEPVLAALFKAPESGQPPPNAPNPNTSVSGAPC